jgi:hypothetical protein
MRVLVTHHLPFNGTASGRFSYELATTLQAAGHEVRCLIVDTVREGTEPFPVGRVCCRAGDPSADLNFDVPSFASETRGRQTYESLTDPQLAAYREAFRRLLDCEVDRFDPHLIHAQHIWVQGQLALETGVIYLLSAWGAELSSYAADPRYRPLADQAAENAGKILVSTRSQRDRVLELFESAADRIVVVPHLSAETLGNASAARPDARAFPAREAFPWPRNQTIFAHDPIGCRRSRRSR